MACAFNIVGPCLAVEVVAHGRFHQKEGIANYVILLPAARHVILDAYETT